jgi:hypothetical protein
MKHTLRHQQSRRLDRETGRWRSAGGSTQILEAMLKALARQQANMTGPASSSQSQSQFPDHHDRGQPAAMPQKEKSK